MIYDTSGDSTGYVSIRTELLTVTCTCGTTSCFRSNPHESSCPARIYWDNPMVRIVHESSLKSEPKGGLNNRAERRKQKAQARRKPKLNKIQEARLNKLIKRLVSQ